MFIFVRRHSGGCRKHPCRLLRHGRSSKAAFTLAHWSKSVAAISAARSAFQQTHSLSIALSLLTPPVLP